MKLRSLICVSAAMAAIAASATTTLSAGNQFARLEVNTPFTSSIIALPLRGCGESSAQIYVTNLVMTANLENGDTLLWKNDLGNWFAWEIETVGGNKQWKALRTTDVANGKKEGVNITNPANETAIPCGEACWLIRSTPSNKVYLYGQVNTGSLPTATVYGPGSGQSMGYTLIGRPEESTAVDLNTWHPANAATGDQVIVPAANGSTGQTTYKYSGTAWQSATQSVTQMTNPRTKATTYVTNTTWTAISTSTTIPAGTGFMYGRAGSGSTTLNW